MSIMKKYIALLLIIFATAIVSNAQSAYNITDSPTKISINKEIGLPVYESNLTQNYKSSPEWGKYIVLRSIGWAAFGIGAASLSAGVITILWEHVLTGKHSPTAIALLSAGSVLTVSSIPILISAYHYRNKAKKMTLNVGLTSLKTPLSYPRTDFSPALNFSITF